MSAALAISVLIVAVIICMAISKNIRVVSFNGLSGLFDAYWKIFGVSLIISYFICSIIFEIFGSIFNGISNIIGSIASIGLPGIAIFVCAIGLIYEWMEEKDLDKKINDGDIESILKLGKKQATNVDNSDSVKFYMSLGNEYLEQKDYDSAIENYQSAYDAGCKEAMSLVNGIKKFKGLNSYKSDEDKKLNHEIYKYKKNGLSPYDSLLQSANNGDSNAIKLIGDVYFYGFGSIKQNHSEALEWYKKAANAGNEEAKEKYENLTKNN